MLDKAKNIAYKSVKVDYEEEDNKIITSDISYDITHLTNKDVVATVKAYVFTNGQKKNATIVSGGETHTFNTNGKFTFQYKDSDDSDDYVTSHTAKVTWIDKVAPTAKVKYTTKENGEVVATLVNESEKIIITNNGFSRERNFKKNGEFTFIFEDEAGNEGRVTAKVTSIKEEKPNKPNNQNPPSTPGKPSYTKPSTSIKPSNRNKNVNTSTKKSSNKKESNNKATLDETNKTKDEDSKETTNKKNNAKEATNDNYKNRNNNTIEDNKSDSITAIRIIIVIIIIIFSAVTAGVYLKKKKDSITYN